MAPRQSDHLYDKSCHGEPKLWWFCTKNAQITDNIKHQGSNMICAYHLQCLPSPLLSPTEGKMKSSKFHGPSHYNFQDWTLLTWFPNVPLSDTSWGKIPPHTCLLPIPTRNPSGFNHGTIHDSSATPRAPSCATQHPAFLGNLDPQLRQSETSSALPREAESSRDYCVCFSVSSYVMLLISHCIHLTVRVLK